MPSEVWQNNGKTILFNAKGAKKVVLNRVEGAARPPWPLPRIRY